MNASAIARVNDSISDRVNEEHWRAHEAREQRLREIRAYAWTDAEETVEDAGALQHQRDAFGLNYGEMGVQHAGTPITFDRAFDLMRFAVLRRDIDAAAEIAEAVQKELTAHIAAQTIAREMKKRGLA